jgi:Ran GTPase-activating protein (RanGAP) involved in mRNA processing and transport
MTPWTAEALAAPISPEIIEPKPMPVVPGPLSELKPLLGHLSEQAPTPIPMAFPRGTLMPDGRLDLCKQVVGPAGIGPLLSAVSDNPQVRRLLLGNNIVGNAGAAQIADFITSGRSPVRVWYIAGNQIDAEGIGPVVDALCQRDDVEGLWLKRNPLKPAGAVHIARLIRQDTPIQTLDLVNTGLLDEGVAVIAEALADNHHLRHLYLGTNGITPAGLTPLVARLGADCRLTSLFLSCNRIGDEGAAMLAGALRENRSLVRLGLSSDRIGPEGAAVLAEAIAEHPTLRSLDLGWTRATAAVGELGNRIGNDGCRSLAAMLRVNRVLSVLDISHNGISQHAIDAITEALEAGNTSLVDLRHPQLGKAINHDALGRLHALLERNRVAAGVDPEEIRTPTPTREILSVYRTA